MGCSEIEFNVMMGVISFLFVFAFCPVMLLVYLYFVKRLTFVSIPRDQMGSEYSSSDESASQGRSSSLEPPERPRAR
ncbi:hypothetical protein ColKHC_03520 [Colletotrichum higginsianum]|uniref:Uncharacterized protein n=1 Tax=Colletotrichum higginsianum TaxID=80884 RepID=A0A4T0W3R9_9PEZI|nr:hypothetical protein CH35J_004919 [Colletotrichum higginsianum]GJC94694.1 hypothetical protein ColKHC_03520 [Colletotrichum higginsianum]